MFISQKHTFFAGAILGIWFILGALASLLAKNLLIVYQLSMFVGLVLVPPMLMWYQRKQVGGVLNYGKTFQAGFLPIFFGVFLLSVFYGLYMYLNPAAFEFEKLKTSANLTAAGMSKEKIQETLSAMSPIKSTLTFFMTFWLVGTLFCLLFSAFLYRSPKS